MSSANTNKEQNASEERWNDFKMTFKEICLLKDIAQLAPYIEAAQEHLDCLLSRWRCNYRIGETRHAFKRLRLNGPRSFECEREGGGPAKTLLTELRGWYQDAVNSFVQRDLLYATGAMQMADLVESQLSAALHGFTLAIEEKEEQSLAMPRSEDQ